LTLTVGVMILWSALKPTYQHGIHIVSLVLTGYLPLTLWRHMSQCATYAVRRNAGVLYHRNVTLLDAVFSRFAIEFLGTTTALAFVSTILITSGLVEPIQDYGLVILGWFTMAALSLGFGLVIGAATEYSEVVERILQPLQYFLLPISGCFFMVDWLPTEAQTLALYVPMVHVYEMFRAGFFDEGVRTYYTVEYPLIWALCAVALGVRLLMRVRDRVGVS
jgi:capsular polysaccharide transport system permease protein